MLDIYVEKIEKIENIKNSDIFENITIFPDPGFTADALRYERISVQNRRFRSNGAG